MAQITISNAHEDFLRQQVEAGIFSSIADAAENAIQKQMELAAQEQARIQSVHDAIAVGEADIAAGHTITYTPGLMAEIAQKGKATALAGRQPMSSVQKFP